MMRALLKYAEREPGPVPFRLGVHLVAARYGTTPDDVRAWPADDYADAVAFLEVTAPPVVRFEP
jgi:hypothetical protein